MLRDVETNTANLPPLPMVWPRDVAPAQRISYFNLPNAGGNACWMNASLQAMMASSPQIKEYYRAQRDVGLPTVPSRNDNPDDATNFERGLSYVLAVQEGSLQAPADGVIGNRATVKGALAVMNQDIIDKLRVAVARDADRQMDATNVINKLVDFGIVSQESPINTQFRGQIVTRIHGLPADAQRALLEKANRENTEWLTYPLSRIDDPSTGITNLNAGRLVTALPQDNDTPISIAEMLRNQVF